MLAKVVLLLIACQTATAFSTSSILFAFLFPSLSLLLFLLSSVPSFSIFHWYFRATHPLATYGTPVRKRGVRNVIVPLRGVSWYKAVVLFLILPFSFQSLSADVCPEETTDRVYYAELVTHILPVSFQIELD